MLALFRHFLVIFWSFFGHFFLICLSCFCHLVCHLLVISWFSMSQIARHVFVPVLLACQRSAGSALLPPIAANFDMLFSQQPALHYMSRFHPCTRSCRIWLIFVGCKGYHNALVLGQGLAASSVKPEVLAHASLDDITGVQGLSPFHFQKGVWRYVHVQKLCEHLCLRCLLGRLHNQIWTQNGFQLWLFTFHSPPRMYVCMHACMYACMHVCMYVCR